MRLYTYVASANCLKVRALLGLLDISHDRTEVALFGGETLTDAFERLNPLRETPVLELEDGGTLTQSNAILVFLAGRASADRSLDRASSSLVPDHVRE